MSQESLIEPITPHLILTLTSCREGIPMRFSRILKEKEFLKLGRQVKGAEIPHLHFKEPAEIEIPNAVAVFEASTQIPGNEAPVTRGDDEPLENLWFKSKVVSRVHAEIWLKGGHVYLKDIGSSSGTFLNKLRLSPAGKRSRPYPIKNGDIIQMGVDYQGRAEDIYKAVELKIELEILSLDILRLQQQAPIRFYKALHELLNATNPLSDPAEESEEQEDKSVSCCICLSGIGPFQALFIAPCSHCYHYKCIKNILKDNAMFPCPVCRQVANLDASVSMESLQDIPEFKEKVAIFDRMNVDTEPETLGGGNNQFGLEELLASNV